MASDRLPTARDVHHVGVPVFDLDAAVGLFTDAIGCDVLYRTGPFGDPDGTSMSRRFGVHPEATGRLATFRRGPATNLEQFEWEGPDRDTDLSDNSDVGAMHLGLAVDGIGAAIDALEARPDVEMLDGPPHEHRRAHGRVDVRLLSNPVGFLPGAGRSPRRDAVCRGNRRGPLRPGVLLGPPVHSETNQYDTDCSH